MRYFIFTLLFSAQAFALDCPYTLDQASSYLHARFPESVPASNGSDFGKTQQLEFGNVGFGDADLPYLCPLQNLSALEIYNDRSPANKPDKLTGKNLEYLTLLPHLGYLDLDGNLIPGRELYRLKGMPNLGTFKLGMGNPVGDAGTESLDGIEHLKMLILQANNSKPEDFAWLGRSEKVYDLIYVGDNPGLGNAVIPYLAKGKVRYYEGLDQISITSADGFEDLARNPHLKIFAIPSWNKVIGYAIMQKMAASQSLEEINVPPATRYLDLALQIPTLKKVSTSIIQLSGTEFAFIAQAFTKVDEVEVDTQVFELDVTDLCAKVKAAYPQKKFTIMKWRSKVCTIPEQPQAN